MTIVASIVKESSGLMPMHLPCKHRHLKVIHYLTKEQNCNPESTFLIVAVPHFTLSEGVDNYTLRGERKCNSP